MTKRTARIGIGISAIRTIPATIAFTAFAVCLAVQLSPTTSGMRMFSTPESQTKQGAIRFVTLRLPKDRHLAALLAIPIRGTLAVESADPVLNRFDVTQRFQVVDASFPSRPSYVKLRIRQPWMEYFSNQSRHLERAVPVKNYFEEWPSSQTYSVLCEPVQKSGDCIAIGLQPVKAKKLAAHGNGKVAFFKTLFNELVKLEGKEAFELEWYLGRCMIQTGSTGSVAFATRDPSDIVIAEYALSLARKQQGDMRVYFDFLAGHWGAPEGYEPFFADLRPALQRDKKAIDTNTLRVLAGSIPYGEHFHLDCVVRGTPPTRSNASMIHFALEFTDRPDLLAFLFEFADVATSDKVMSKDEMVRAYLATDKNMAYADRYVVYQSITSYFHSIATIDATPENTKLCMNYPDGLGYPGNDERWPEAEWKRAVDAYWGIQRPRHPWLQGQLQTL